MQFELYLCAQTLLVCETAIEGQTEHFEMVIADAGLLWSLRWHRRRLGSALHTLK
jgi:hypothetical protein